MEDKMNINTNTKEVEILWNIGEFDLNKKSNYDTSQILIEGDIIVPEYKPDIAKIMDCYGQIKERDIKISETQFNYLGDLEIELLYCCNNDGNYNMYSMKNTIPIDEILYIDNLENILPNNIVSHDNLKIYVNTNIIHLETVIVNDRKISIKAIINLEHCQSINYVQNIIVPNITDNLSYDSFNSNENMAFLENSISIEKILEEKKDYFKIKDEYEISDKLPAISEILMIKCSITEKEGRASDGKVIIYSNIIIHTLYRDSNGMCHIHTKKLPFNGNIDVKTVTPKSEILLDLFLSNEKDSAIKVDVLVDDNGEARILDVDIVMDAFIKVIENNNYNIVVDAYSINQDIDIFKETFDYNIPIGIGENQFHIREKIDIQNNEEPIMQVENIFGDIFVDGYEINDDFIELWGVIKSRIMYLSKADDMPFHIIKRDIPFNQRIEIKGIKNKDIIDYDISLEDIDFQIFSENDGEVLASIYLKVYSKRTCIGEFITNIEINDFSNTSEKNKNPAAYIYTVQPDDSLWSIAKEHNTTVNSILGTNIILDNKVTVGDKVLIF